LWENANQTSRLSVFSARVGNLIPRIKTTIYTMLFIFHVVCR
jgi:hypothetical protein